MSYLALVLLFAASDSSKVKVELKATPQFAMLSVGPHATATVRFRLSVKDGGDENYYCPRLEWEWEDQTTSSEESDCPAFESAQKEDHEKVWTKSRTFWEPGQHIIKVRLFKGDRVIRSVETKVEISGESTPGRFRER